MASKNYLSGLFGASPVAPLQAHMTIVDECVTKLIDLFENMASGNTAEVEKIYQKIASLEQQADDKKQTLREHLPSGLFMPIERQDLLDALRTQDLLANRARDIAGIIVGRKLQFPEQAAQRVIELVKATVETCHQALRVVNELDELVETGFRGHAVHVAEVMLAELDDLESATDRIQVSLRADLFAVEKSLYAVDVIFMYQNYRVYRENCR
ncbi:MAG: TIGR00153 family protein [Oleibacter sp.]|uniref:TIGR00153 family protein n=1 Tax=uncultured Cycloclasticus sp. TaxID=172194 RepID=UPI002586072D|nr:TIGR00153 family protein [uncultured Cycloclasticus sp.]MDF1762446.1 TIGR00153 family protein [Thalassolituus sp.]